MSGVGSLRGASPATLLVLLLLHGCAAPLLHAWREVKRPCPAGCEALGNCNAEFGTCECPFGRTGPACEQHLLSACRTSDDPRALPFYGFAHPKSCECWRQLAAYGRSIQRNTVYLDSLKGLLGGAKWCYQRKGVPPERQFSDPPEVTDPNIEWFQPMLQGATLEQRPLQEPPKELVYFSRTKEPKGPKIFPLDRCPNRCNERGTCLDGHCQCMQGLEGASCELPHHKQIGCMNWCSGRGKCVGGFCHCPPGWWGQDCSRSKAFEPDPNMPEEVEGKAQNRTHLKIYRWELPWNLAFPFAQEDAAYGYNQLYSAFEMFYNAFTIDTVTRTENIGEANLFYIPLLEFFMDDNAGDVFEYTRRTMHALKDQEPYRKYWARHQGKDHFVWLPGDLGACWLLDEPEVQNPIKVVHWGLQINASAYTHMPHYWWVKDHPVNKEYHCFKYEKDVVTPCWVDDHAKEMSHSELVYREALEGKERRYLLFFGGGIRHQQPEYSGGARQAFDKHVVSKKHPEILFGGGREAYREATFCLAPYGDGWGSRLPHIMQAACIPVIIQEFVHQAFDDVLNYEEFSIRLNVADMPNLVDILKAVTPEQILRYRQKMYEVHKAFHWITPLGGQAYNYTLLSLHKKLHNLWAGHY